MFRHSFSFDGRIRRTECGISFIIYVLLVNIVNPAHHNGNANIFVLIYIPILWFTWPQGSKRCHDLGNNGWWQIIPFYFFWMLFERGQPYLNRYGSDPKKIKVLMKSFHIVI